MSEFIAHFGVNWQLLLAQVINFALLFLVLKKFAFGPLGGLLRARREKIKEGIRMHEEARHILDELDLLRAERVIKAEKEAYMIMQDAQRLARDRGEELITATHEKAETIIADARRIIAQEKEKISQDAIKDTRRLIAEGIRRVIGKLPPETRDGVLIEDALRAIKTGV
ncbi:MAG: F-type H+-transporting ATPase subunit b [Parcubacteria group bacterium Gr01-1014_66]|nr:MAG: F-type H+-transporting ATPase subunit b [Parcubacteria group bacterium Gr01-1014_66]